MRTCAVRQAFVAPLLASFLEKHGRANSKHVSHVAVDTYLPEKISFAPRDYLWSLRKASQQSLAVSFIHK